MGWNDYLNRSNGYPAEQAGASSPLLPYGAAQLADARLPQQVLDQRQAAQNAMAAATSMAPHSSGLATALQGLSGYVGGSLQAQADRAAAPYQGQGGQLAQPSASLLGALLRGQAPSPSGQDDGSTPPATGWAGVGQGAAQALGGIGRKSDRRLKSDVVRVGALACGLPLYAYRLEGSPLFEVGVMADEVALVRPDATWLDPDDGFARVDYERLI